MALTTQKPCKRSIQLQKNTQDSIVVRTRHRDFIRDKLFQKAARNGPECKKIHSFRQGLVLET